MSVFTPDEVASINAFQQCGYFHEFTCLNGDTLVATEDGLMCPNCDFKQEWAHDFMKNWEWKDVASSFLKAYPDLGKET